MVDFDLDGDLDLYYGYQYNYFFENENGYFNFSLNQNFDNAYLEFSHIAYETVQWRGATQDVIHIKMKVKKPSKCFQ